MTARVDWDRLVHAAVFAAFGEASRVGYTIQGGPSLTVDGIFDEGAMPLTLDGVSPPSNQVRPTLGIRLSQFPAGYDPRNAKGDTFTITKNGATVAYTVKDGRPDGKGWALLEATRS